MDLSIQLKLDSAAFDAALASARQSLDQLKAAAAPQDFAAAQDAAASLAQSLAGIQPPDMAVDNTPLREAAETAQQLAGRIQEVAAASANAAAAANQDLAAALKQAHGGMGILNGTTAMASGSLQGMAGGAIQAANGMRMLGASMRTAMLATGVLAAIAAAVAAVSAVCNAAADNAQKLADQKFEGIQGAAERLSRTFSDMQGEIARTLDLTNRLESVDASGRRLEREKKLAEIERDRAKAIASARRSGGDEAAINKQFDERRRAVEFEGRRSENADTLAELQRRLESNREQKRNTMAEWDNLGRTRDAHLDIAAEEARKARTALFGIGSERHGQEADRNRQAAAEVDEKLKAVRAQAQALDDEAKVLQRKIEVEKGRASLIDTQETAATAAAAIPEKRPEEKSEPEERAAHRSESFGSLQTASDRLARIGGFVGGGYMVQNQAREQLQVARQQQKLLEQIERNTSQGGQGAAILS